MSKPASPVPSSSTVASSPLPIISVTPIATSSDTSNGLGDAIGDCKPVSVAAQRLELLPKMLGIRVRKTVRHVSLQVMFWS